MNTRTAIALAFFMTLATGCDREGTAWQEAQQADTMAAYEAYLKEHGDSPQAREAGKRIHALRAAELWEQTKQAEAAEPYQRFVEQFPDTEEADQARVRLAEIERQNEWEALRNSTDIDALQSFAMQYGEYPVGQQAQQRVTDLEKAQELEQARLEAERAEDAKRTHRVQLAARRSQKGARDGASSLEKQLASALGGVTLEVAKAGNYYLIRTTPLKKTEAQSLCERLKTGNQDCLVVSR